MCNGFLIIVPNYRALHSLPGFSPLRCECDHMILWTPHFQVLLNKLIAELNQSRTINQLHYDYIQEDKQELHEVLSFRWKFSFFPHKLSGGFHS